MGFPLSCRYVDANVRQVMNYLDAYRNRGGRVPEKTYAALRDHAYLTFTN